MEREDQPTEFLSTDEAAKLLGIARNTLHKKTMRKELPFYRIGGYIRFKRTELMDWIEQRRVEPEGTK